MFRSLDSRLGLTAAGCALLFVCTAFYLLWWCIAFRPGGHYNAVSTTSLVLAFLTGIPGVILGVIGVNSNAATAPIASRWIWLGAAVFYFAALAVTYFALKRQVTSELLIFTLWAALMLCVCESVHGLGVFGPGLTVVLCALTLDALAVCVVCYVLYYRLQKPASFYDGMIPLIAAGAMTAVITAAVVICGSGAKT